MSLNINDSSGKDEPVFGNGYHVISENFFLPTPKNFIEPRLFVLKNDGSGLQFLSDNQLNNFLKRAELDGYELHQEPSEGEATYLQYSRPVTTKVQSQIDQFSKPLNLHQ